MRTFLILVVCACLSRAAFAQAPTQFQPKVVGGSSLDRIANSLENMSMDLSSGANDHIKKQEAEIARWEREAQAQFGADMAQRAQYYYNVATMLYKKAVATNRQLVAVQNKLDKAEREIENLRRQLQAAKK